MRHFLEVDDLSPDELSQVLDLAEISRPPKFSPAAGWP